MHDTAYAIGTRFLQTYGAGARLVVEVGALDVNGSLRRAAPAGAAYVGLDMEPGRSVDVVVAPGRPLPLRDGCADVVLASSVFEHDPAFWRTFADMRRIARPGGYIYISAPSNGMVHRYPLDCWRLYPDAGLALEQASRSEGPAVALVESFTAERQADTWNDFVAVFQRGPAAGAPPERLHRHTRCTNVYDMALPARLSPDPLPEDARLLAAARAELAAALQEVASLAAQVGELRAALARVDGSGPA